MTFGSQVDEPAAHRIIDWCFDNGIDFFDTANSYTGGASETMLGRCLKGRRDKCVLATKVRNKTAEAEGLSRDAIFRAVEASLRRLGTDYVDLYYLHQPDYAVPIAETLEAMDALVKQGKVRFPATSNYSAWQVTQALWIAEKNGYAPATVSQPMYNLLARGIEQEYLPMSKEFGIATCVYNPLAGGLLTGKQKREAPEAGSRFDKNQMYLDRYWHEAYFGAVEELQRATDRPLANLALAWLTHHTDATCIILGASRLEHLQQNVAAMSEGPLPPEVLAACDRVWQNLRGVTPKYNR